MIINAPVHTIEENDIVYSSEIEFLGSKDNLYFKVDQRYESMLTLLSDPVVIAMLIPCMAEPVDLTVKGKVSKELYNNLDKIQDILCTVIPRLTKINVYADEIVDQKSLKKDKAVLAGFSAGVDAFITFQDYYLNPKYDTKVTHFLFNNLTYGKTRVNLKLKNIKKLQSKYEFNLIETWTNLHSFYRKGKKIGFEQTHTMRNAAIPHFLGQNTEFLYSSTFHKDMIAIKESNDLAIADDILLPLLSTKHVNCKAVGSEYTRLQKTLMIADITDSYNHLDTCIGKQFAPFINCGTCRKCTRALLTFELVNKTNKFKDIINIEAWNNIKNDYIKDLPNRTQLNDNELYNYIKENGYEI